MHKESGMSHVNICKVIGDVKSLGWIYECKGNELLEHEWLLCWTEEGIVFRAQHDAEKRCAVRNEEPEGVKT